MHKKLFCLLLALMICGMPIVRALSEDFVVVEDENEESMPEEVLGDISLLTLDGDAWWTRRRLRSCRWTATTTPSSKMRRRCRRPMCVVADEAYVLVEFEGQTPLPC